MDGTIYYTECHELKSVSSKLCRWDELKTLSTNTTSHLIVDLLDFSVHLYRLPV